MTDTPQDRQADPTLRRTAPTLNPLVKLALEFGPLALFFIASARTTLVAATGTLMVGVVVALAISFALTRRVPTMPLVTAVAVLLFGGLTLYFNNPVFIKMKPTILNCIFGTALLGGLAFGKPLLPIVLDVAFHLDRPAWAKLTFRWGVFFFFLAALNEVVWRTQSDVFWAAFKVFGTMPITIVFALSQVPFMLRHEVKGEATTEDF